MNNETTPTTSAELLGTQIRPKFYLDSVALMRHSKAVAEMQGVVEAAMMMATPANKEIMFNAGLLESDSPDADGGDLIISVRGTEQSLVDAAMDAAIHLLDQPKSGVSAALWRPRSIRSAKEHLPEANLALISVAGEFAASEARKALRAGMHAMIFSDNVALESEAELKREAAELGRLVMGPDCGTSIIGGVPLAFANRVSRGNIGIVGASGTGIQEVSCLIDHAGKGISHAIGVGGRDLHEAVGGISTLMALEALDADEGTEHIVIISKPPAAAVATLVLDAVSNSSKTFTICFIGAGSHDYPIPTNATLTPTLKQTAEHAAGSAVPEPGFGQAERLPALSPDQTGIVGLYCGGTLCAEAQVIVATSGSIPASNTPIPGAVAMHQAKGKHQFIDLGADEYTQGKPHPMIEPSIRDDALLDAVNRQDVGALVMDIVIGYGAHADPAGQLVNAMAAIKKRPAIIASVTGTESDPQVRSRQINTLMAAGVVVAGSNADAVDLALQHVSKAAV